MPSKGSPIVPIRVPQLLLVQIEQVVERWNASRPPPPGADQWTRSRFIIDAIEEKLRHLERSRRSG